MILPPKIPPSIEPAAKIRVRGISRLKLVPRRPANPSAEVITITSKEVAVAVGMGKPKEKIRIGTTTTPPPIPKKPVSSPVPVAARKTMYRGRRGAGRLAVAGVVFSSFSVFSVRRIV